jgi:hypothetical protein
VAAGEFDGSETDQVDSSEAPQRHPQMQHEHKPQVTVPLRPPFSIDHN